ncbi:MAG: hypothetical protein ACRC9H_10040 [Aeromonas veronii]
MAEHPGSRLTLDFTLPQSRPDGGAVPLDFNNSVVPPVGVGVGPDDIAVVGRPAVANRRAVITASGWESASFPDWRSQQPIIEVEQPTPIWPVGWVSDNVGQPVYVRWRRFLLPPSIPFSADLIGVSSVRLAGGYQPAPGVNTTLNFSEPLVRPPGSHVVLEFGEVGYTHVASAGIGDTSHFGRVSFGIPRVISDVSLADQAEFGVPMLEGTVRFISLNTSILPPGIDKPTLTKKAAPLLPPSMTPSLYGTAYVWNLRQYLRPTAFSPLAFGAHYLIGGVKSALPGGIAGLAMGAVKVVNTRANQTAAPSGIPAIAMVAPGVSPRSLAPSGASTVLWGLPRVQKMPLLAGWQSDVYGAPVIEFKTKYLLASGFAYTEQGYPRVFDPTQITQVKSLLETGLFGDGRVYNKTRTVRASGLDALYFSDWTDVVNTRRVLAAASWSAMAVGWPEIANKTPSLHPPGINSFNPPSGYLTGIGYRNRTLTPSGIPFVSPALGSPVVTKTPQLFPLGFAGAFGAPEVERWLRFLEVAGANCAQYGMPTVWFGYRPLPVPGWASQLYGDNARVEHGRRTLLALGANAAAVGGHGIGNANRTLRPTGIPVVFPGPPMVGGTRFLRPVGFEATKFGARVIPEIQSCYPRGFAGEYGRPHLYNLRQTTAPKGFLTVGQQPADRWGTPRVWNLLQFVVQNPDAGGELFPPAWPQWTLIENRNKSLRATGQDLSALGLAQIDNNARLLAPVGANAPDPGEFYRSGTVGYRIRYFRMEGMEPPYLAGWATVYNSAFVAAPLGVATPVFGRPAIVNTRRYYDFTDGADTAVFGYPMVADRIRYLDIEGRYGINPPYIQLPEVKLYSRYIDGRGTDMSKLGWASLDIHWTIIAPKWSLQNLYGSPTVRNLTPELNQQGRNSEAFGDPYLRLQWRPVNPIGEPTHWFGKPIAGYRDRPLFMTGIRSWAIGDKLVVTKTGAPPYSTQFIYLDRNVLAGEDDPEKYVDGDGIPPLPLGQPIINQQVVYHRQPDPATGFGDPRLTANSIRVEPGHWLIAIGDPMVSSKNRTIAVGEYKFDDQSLQGKPRLSPHTIYAVVEAPAQAIRNHPLPGTIGHHYVDGYYRAPGANLGWVSVMNRHRFVRGNDFATASYGQPDVELLMRYLEPKGINSLRVGWITIPGPQDVTQFNSSQFMALGTPRVSRPIVIGPSIARPSGLNSFSPGDARVELLHRELPLPGFLSMQMGTKKANDTPYQWQGLRVGPLMPTIAAGYVTERHGKPWVSFRVRELQAEGFTGFSSEYELEAFMSQMKVWRVPIPKPSQHVTPVGIAGGAVNASDVKLNQQFIRPDGNADQYRKGAF